MANDVERAVVELSLILKQPIGAAPAINHTTQRLVPFEQNFSSGTAAGKLSRAHVKRYTIAASSVQDIDLSSAALETTDMEADNMTGLRAIVVALPDDIEDQASSVKVDPSVTNAYTTLAGTLKPGGALALLDKTAAGIAAVDGTHKIIQIENNDGTNDAVVDVYLLGIP